MIGIIARIGAVVVASIVPPAVGDQIRVENGLWRNNGNGGGEFRITTLSGFAGLNGLASDTSGDTFQSFCLEAGSAIQTGSGSGHANEYDFTMGNASVPGGSPGPSDPISFETAYLFTQFRTGVLSNYDFGNTVDRKASAEALQNAIWFLEGEISLVSGQAADWVTEAQAAVGGGAWGQTLGLVRVLVLTQTGNERQDVLTLIPLPPAAWAGLAGLAIVPVIRARRRVP